MSMGAREVFTSGQRAKLHIWKEWWFEYISENLCNSLMFAAVLEQFCYRMLHVISTVIRRIFLCFVCSNMDIASAWSIFVYTYTYTYIYMYKYIYTYNYIYLYIHIWRSHLLTRFFEPSLQARCFFFAAEEGTRLHQVSSRSQRQKRVVRHKLACVMCVTSCSATPLAYATWSTLLASHFSLYVA